jgi:hypothetical protein
MVPLYTPLFFGWTISLSGGNTKFFSTYQKKVLFDLSFSAKFFRSTATEGDSQAANSASRPPGEGH